MIIMNNERHMIAGKSTLGELKQKVGKVIRNKSIKSVKKIKK